ncbi:hypothetical protein LCGC14_0295350 [marine sediment metagenome]|uniref:Uncharacterized protein n=1 Tax=marine sediment metagenome TaxID=412755 RepID=A0A0F9U970_9ZZZZ
MVTNTDRPEVGQIWADLDKRMVGRKVVIDYVDPHYVRVHSLISGRHATISRRRLRPTHNGFELVGKV